MDSNDKYIQQYLFDDKECDIFSINQDNYNIFIQTLNSINDCEDSIKNYLKTNSQIVKKILSSAAVFIKVNLTSGEIPENGRTTSPVFLKQLVLSIHSIGVPYEKIIIGDSSVIGVNTINASKIAGIYEICQEFNITFYDLVDGPFSQNDVLNPLKHNSIEVHDIFLQSEVFKINCAKIKTTYGSPIGFCVKNLKGIIPDETKLSFHLRGVQESLVDLRNVVTCDLNILEGFPGSELGIPRECKLIGISNNDYLLDAIIAEIIGISYMEVPHLKWLCNSQENFLAEWLSKSTLKSIKSKMPNFQFTVHGLEEMSAFFSIEIIDGKPCTSCVESFYKAVLKLSKQKQLPYDFTYVIGQWHVNTDWELYNSNQHVFVGECALLAPTSAVLTSCNHKTIPTKKSKYVNHDICNKGVVVPGCPPTIDSMVKILRKTKHNYSNHRNKSQLHDSPATYTHSPIIDKWITILPIQNFLTAQIISKVIPLTPPEKVTFCEFNANLAIQCELIAAAICHQMNWDFLRFKIKEAANEDPTYWDFNRLEYFSKTDIDKLLTGYPKKERFFSEQRASMLRSLNKLSDGKHNTLAEIFCSFISSPNSAELLLSLLNQSSVFADDPVQKKTQVFLSSLFRSNLFSFPETNLVKPAIDHHIMRLYIRRGNIYNRTKTGYNYLRENIKRRSSTTSALRALVAEAMKNISSFSSHSIVNVNVVEWWVGRTICSMDNPDCDMKTDRGKWLKTLYTKCPYKKICYAQTCDKTLLLASEPIESSKFY